MISEEYRALNRELHSRGHYGRGGYRWASKAIELLEEHDCKTVLDYGCGQSSLAKALPFPIAEYDPAIAGKEADPEPADLVICTDVFEHIEREHLDAVLKHLHSKTRRVAFLAIATRPAVKHLADGRNAHLIVEPADWWRDRLEPLFEIREWQVRPGEVAIVAVPILSLGEIKTKGVVGNDARFENTKRNVDVVSKRIIPTFNIHDKVAVLACYGPSLAETWPTIAEERKAGVVASVSGAHDFLTGKGLIPDFHVECDPRPHKSAMVTPDKRVQYLLASCCDPDWVARLAQDQDVTLWHMINGEPDWRIDDLEPGAWFLSGGGSVGLRAIGLFYALGYRTFRIHGMDCSFAAGEQHAGPHSGKTLASIRVRCGDCWFDTSRVLVSYARQFFKTIACLPDATFDLHGDGLLQAMCRQATTEKSDAN